MKKIAVLTDFSERAYHAAEYALLLAARLQANVLLYNSFLVPSAEPLAGQIVWPMEDYDEIKNGCEADLEKLKARLEGKLADQTNGFRPKIECRAHDAQFDLTADEFLRDRDLLLFVLGNHQKGFSGLILGNHTREVLNRSALPVLVVPEKAVFEPLHKIAFATDLGQSDLQVVQSLTGLARPFNAEILLTHLCESTPENSRAVQDFLHEVTNKVNYPHIYYRHLEEKHLREGLHHMAETVKADLVVMVHRHKDFLERLFSRSHSLDLAEHTELPLLIFPSPAKFFPVI
ncbi:universal stress protein [Mucilaginibacter sp. CAU 1740]|uniref:universal stress protein n=1 Tax=Mucilaginibacter sp. CAU 1740 TaxID=3140365 RepID=UPI00325C0BF9